MACEKKGVHGEVAVVCTVPPVCPAKEQSSGNDQTKFKVLAAITVVAIVVAGVVGVAYLVSHSNSSGGSILDKSTDEHPSERNRQEVLVHFYYKGKLQSEMMTKDKDENLVTIIDEKTGFLVTQDYDRAIVLIKNTTSSDCFFTHLGYIQTPDMTTLKPIVVEEVANVTSTSVTNKENTVLLLRSDVIPPEYVQVSNRPAISKQCVDSTSYWLKGSPPSPRVRRRPFVPPPPVMPEPELPNWWYDYVVLRIGC